MTTTDVAISRCFDCGTVLEAATGRGDAVPSPGNFSVCFTCGAILRFDDELKACQLTDSDVFDLAACPEVAIRLKDLQKRIRARRARLN